MTDINAPFSLSNPWGFPVDGRPLRCSVPLPQGAVKDPAKELVLCDAEGRDVGVQWRVLSTWKDGSARFALFDYAEPGLAPRETKRYTLTQRKGNEKPAPSRAVIQVNRTGDAVTIDTGALKWTLSIKRFALAESIEAHGREWVRGLVSDLLVVDANGQRYRASQGEYKLTFEYEGPHRVIVLNDGDYRNAVGRFMNYKLRLHFVAGSSQVLLQHTIRNREPGREGRDLTRSALEAGIHIGPTNVRRILHRMRTKNTIEAPVDVPENVDIDVQSYESRIRNIASLRQDPDDICYSLQTYSDLASQAHVAPLIDMHEPGVGGLLVKFNMPEPPREAPMRLASEGGQFEVDFFPDTGEAIHLNEGMGKTRDVLLNFHDDSLDAHDLMHVSDGINYPGVVGVPRQMYRKAEFADVHLTLTPQRNKYPLLESKIDTLLAAQWSYDWPVATGWRDWGDEVGARGRMPEFGKQQFINNEEDYIYCRMLDAWRLGQPYAALTQVRHLMDIDYMDFSTDPARDGGVCPHSTEHTNGETYPSHQWCQGLLYYHLATGDLEALRIARRIGDNLIWWVTGPRNDSLTYSGRESAWPLLALAALYDVTHDERYRDAGMVIIQNFIDSVKEHGTLKWEYPPGSGIYSGYMYAMVFNGVWDMYAATGDEAVLDLWKTITTPVIDALSDPESWGYVHFRNWPIKWADLTVLSRWYYLTKDERYVQLGRNGMRLILAGCPQPLNQTQGFIAMGYRHFILYLKLADEFGLLNDDDTTLVW